LTYPVADGNKRVAFAAVDVFLRINDYRVTATSRAIHTAMIGTRTFDVAHIQPWLRAMVKER
jgi:death-on-curing protein